MIKQTALDIANYLYQSECIDLEKLEDICNDHKGKKRRCIVEPVLKCILMGPDKYYNTFIKALEESNKAEHIAEKLKAETVTDAHIQKYKAFEEYTLNPGSRPDNEESRLKFTRREKRVLMLHIDDESVIDRINDHLLSMFFTSRKEHNDVVNCSFSNSCRVKELIKKMTTCPVHLKEPLFTLLVKMKLEHVVEKLTKKPTTKPFPQSRKRKRKSEGIEPVAKKSAKRLSDDEEEHVVMSIANSPSVIEDYTIDTIGFDIDEISKGSIVIQMHPRGPDSWYKLEEKCRSGEIKDYIRMLFNIAAVRQSLQEGEYRIKFTIYTKETQDGRKCVFHLGAEKLSIEDAVVGRQLESPIIGQLDLLCEEIEITDELLNILKKEKIVQRNIKQEIDLQETREMKIEYLLMKIASHGANGYEVLKRYIKRNNENLYRNMLTREHINAINRIPTENSVRRTRRKVAENELYFTGTAILKVMKTNPRKKRGQQTSSVKVSCPGFIDPVMYRS